MKSNELRHSVCAPADDLSSSGGASNGGTLAQAKSAVASTARDAASRVKSAVGETAERAKSEAQRLAGEAKDDTARRLGGYSSAVHESAKSLEQEDPNIAWAVHQAADRIQGVADYVRNRDFAELRNDAENFARRHPVAFFGGLFLGGLVIGNLLKARAPAPQALEPGNERGSTTANDLSAQAAL